MKKRYELRLVDWQDYLIALEETDSMKMVIHIVRTWNLIKDRSDTIYIYDHIDSKYLEVSKCQLH